MSIYFEISFYNLILAVLLTHVFCSSCPPDSVTTYEFIREEEYDRNISSSRPLGYVYAVWKYNVGVANPCIRITSSWNKALELTVETVANSRLCVKGKLPNSDDEITSTCLESNFQAFCRRSIATLQQPDVYFEFFCDDSCAESDVSFWYRFTMSENEISEVEPWCDNRMKEFPSDLQHQFPPNVILPEASSTPIPNIAAEINTGKIWTSLALLSAVAISFTFK